MPSCTAPPMSCGICICNPNLLSVGNCALNIAPTAQVCGGGVGAASCGMAQVTIAAAKSSPLLWLAAGGALLYLLSRRRRA
jgi:hypothetical protein